MKQDTTEPKGFVFPVVAYRSHYMGISGREVKTSPDISNCTHQQNKRKQQETSIGSSNRPDDFPPADRENSTIRRPWQALVKTAAEWHTRSQNTLDPCRRMAVCCHDRYSLILARCWRSAGYQKSGVLNFSARYSRMAMLQMQTPQITTTQNTVYCRSHHWCMFQLSPFSQAEVSISQSRDFS